MITEKLIIVRELGIPLGRNQWTSERGIFPLGS